jgi:hypothetical protein
LKNLQIQQLNVNHLHSMTLNPNLNHFYKKQKTDFKLKIKEFLPFFFFT